MNTQTRTGFAVALVLLLSLLTDAAIFNRQTVAQRLKAVTKSNIRRIPFSLVGDNYDDCKKSADPGDICIFDPSTIHPTQFGLGLDEVACKIGRIESMSSKELDDYLLDHIAPVIIGPDAFYITDHHHLARAMVDADIDKDEKYMYGQIVYNWHDYPSMEAFWQEMITAGEVWLYDEKGMQPVDPQFIPSTVEELLNDPFRSLAWMVQNNGGYSKTVGADFQEFLWANYFRANIPLPKTTTKEEDEVKTSNNSIVPPSTQTKWSWCSVRPYDTACLPNEQSWLQSGIHIPNYPNIQVLPQAMSLAASPEASSLPGYGTGEVDQPNCG